MINVLIVDDQNITHRLIETYLEPEPEIEIIGFANNGQEAIEQVTTLQPDIVLMDVEMPRMNGLEATKVITKQFPLTKVLMLSVHDNEKHLSQALHNGAKGYLLKTTTSQELKTAIRYVNQGYFQLSLELTEKYLYKIISKNSESESIHELKRKINYLYKALSKLELKLDKSPTDSLDENIAITVANILQKEMVLLGDRDSHLQFKVDKMKHGQGRMHKSISYLFRIQLTCIVIAIVSLIYSIFSNLN